MNKEKIIKEYMRELGKKSWKKNKKSREYMSKLGKLSAKKRAENKAKKGLSPSELK